MKLENNSTFCLGGLTVQKKNKRNAASPVGSNPSGGYVQDTNPNTQWIHRRGFKRFYAFLVAAIFFLLKMLGLPTPASVTGMLVIHALVTFFLLHWIRGVPEGGALSEELAHMTFWEMLDHGYLFTPTRRYLSVAPVLLFFVSVALTRDDINLLIVNSLATALVIIPKHEALFGVRLFGINKLE